MRIVNAFLALAAAFGLVTSIALAGGDDAKKTCDKSKAECKASCSGESAVALSHCMPKMVMTVGEKTYNCPVEAAAAAKKDGKSVVYTVAGHKYDCQEKAMTAYADVLDDFVVKFASVRTKEECEKACSGSGCCSGEKSASCCSSGSKAKTTGVTGEVAHKDAKGECAHAKEGTETHGKAVAAKEEAKGECPFAKA